MRANNLPLVVLAACLTASPLAGQRDHLTDPMLAGPGQNLVTNGSFDTSISGWSTSGGTIGWNALDSGSSGSSGSIVVTNTASSAGQVQGATHCIALGGSEKYSLSFKARIPSGQSRTGSASAQAFWYPSADCTGSVAATPSYATADVKTLNSWAGWSTQVAHPSGVASLRIYLRVEKSEAGGEFRAHFDNVTLVQMETLTIPAAASIHGKAGTFFHTDLWVMNRSYTNTKNVTFRYRCFAGQSCIHADRSTSVSPRKTTLESDVVGDLLMSPETAGAIEIIHNPGEGPLSVLSRVYTPSLPAPTTGTAIPALNSSDARTRAVFLGLGTTSGTLATGFRSNAGAYNPNGSSVDVTFTIYNGGTGIMLGEPLTRTWAANEAFQITDIFAAVGATSYDFTNGFLVVTSSAPVFPYVTVVDNQSGDSFYVPASDDEAP